MQSKLSIIKNIIWAVCIVLCLAALLVGIIFAAATKYEGEQQNGMLYLDGSAPQSEKVSTEEKAPAASGLQGTGFLNTLLETDDGGQAYVDTLTFLCDSSLIGLRDYGMLTGGTSTSQVWGSSAGNIPAGDIANCIIKSPADGSDISAVQAISEFKPKILVISLGMDSFDDVSEEEFKANYTALLNSLHTASPDTRLICCAPASVVDGYSGVDELSVDKANLLKDWIMQICMDTGVSFADITRSVCNPAGDLKSQLASANGKSLNSAGLMEILAYLRTHTV